MKSRPGSSVLSGSETMEYMESPYQVKDYQMITMHLREKVHLEKYQGRRMKRGRLGTAPLQNRGLHNYPMQYSRDDVTSAKGTPEQRKERANRMNKAIVDSSATKQHSKDMFDFAVKNAPAKVDKKLEYRMVSDEKRKLRKSSVKSSCSTGPTLDGSVLYNNRARVLNAIRVRPHTDTGCRYNHERSSSKQSLRDTMSQKNDMYQVLDLNQKRRIGSSSSCTSSLFLVPKSRDSHYSDVFDVDSHRPSTVGSVLSELDVFDNHKLYEDSLDDWHTRSPDVGRRIHDQRQLLPPSTPCNTNLVTLDEESTSESETGDAVPEPVKVELHQPSSNRKGKPVVTDTVLVEDPTPPKLILKGPHCWVDDATVTSSHPDSEEIEKVDENNVTPTEPDPKLSSVPNVKNLAATKDSPKDIVEVVVCKDIPGDHDSLHTCRSDGDETAEQLDYILPPFICPSSEKKSREAAIKDWLYASSNFFVYPRSVPLL